MTPFELPDCPTCGQLAGHRCITSTGNVMRVNRWHAARTDPKLRHVSCAERAHPLYQAPAGAVCPRCGHNGYAHQFAGWTCCTDCLTEVRLRALEDQLCELAAVRGTWAAL